MRRLQQQLGHCAWTAVLLSNTSRHVNLSAIGVDVVTLPSPPSEPPSVPLVSVATTLSDVLKAAPAAPAAPKAAPAAPVAPKAAPAAPVAPKVVPAAPVAPKAVPVAPKAVPTAPKVVPVAPKAAPVAPKAVPAAPVAPKAAHAAPVAPKAVPAAPKAVPAAPVAPKAAPAAPAAPKAAPAAPVAPKAAPAAPAAPKAAPAAPVAPKAAPAAPVAPKVVPAAPAAPKAVPAAPVAPKAVPAAPVAPKAVPVAPKAVPAAPKAVPAAPAAPVAPKAVPAAPVAPKAAPAAPVAPKAAHAAPVAPKAAPAAPVAPKAAPAAPVAPKAVPAAPVAPKAAPAAPVAPKAVPAAPVAPKAAHAAPVAPKAVPAAPVAPKAAPAAPAAPNVSRWTRWQRRPVAGASNTLENQRSSSRGAHPQPTERQQADAKHVVACVSSVQQFPHRTASERPAAPPPPSSPPPAPSLSTAPLAPPTPPSTSSAHTTIAPPSVSAVAEADSEATDEKLFEALQPSLSTRIEAAVRQGKAACLLTASHTAQQPQVEQLEQRILRTDTEAHADSSELIEGGATGDWACAKREEWLLPLPGFISSSIDRHEIPAELGGDDGSNVAECTTARSTANDFSRKATTTAPADAAPLLSALAPELSESATMERLPIDVWFGADAASCGKGATAPQRPRVTDNSDVCLVVSTSVTPQKYAITVQLREPPSSPMACVQAVAGALDTVEAHCNTAVTSHTAASVDSALRVAPAITVTWCALPHCSFFAATQSPAELPLSQRVDYVTAKETVMERFNCLVARFRARVHFAAVVSSGSVLDFGAEVFFACVERRLLSLQAAVCDGSDEAAAPVGSSLPSVSTISVGFPLSRVGIFPSTSTVVSMRRLCGLLHTVKWIPVLHTYDASSLADVGLLSLSDATADASDKSRTKQWSLLLEQLIIERVCQSPVQRRWAIEMLLWSRSFHDAAVRHKAAGAMSADIADAWHKYAIGALSRNPLSTELDTARGDAGSVTRVHLLLTTPPCKGAAHALQVHARSLRRSLPPLPHHRFLAFPRVQYSLWMDKVQTLTAEKSVGAVVLLDCSEKAVTDTLNLVKTHLVGTAAQRARLPYLNVVLIGEAAATQRMLQHLPCAAVITSASAFCEMGHASVQQVRLYVSPNWPADLQQDTLLAALTYLKRRGVPHVVAASAAPQRLLLALCNEAVLIARSLPDATAVESAAKEQLGLCLGPFQLMDAYGTVTVATMAADERTRTAAASDAGARAAVTPAHPLESCMRSMAREGLLGARGARGGFYGPAVAMNRGGAAAPLLREAVLSTYVRHHMTPIQVGNRLRAAVLNVACELLTRGEVQLVDDVDLLSMSALGWREETGGVLYQVDQLGADALPRLVEHMTCLASTGSAPHLAPHPLLLRMVAEKVRFANLHDSGLL
ncbi:3-hydroxyacyl-CoA dehydrogenase, C-terminal domain containing protein, putative [Leishmania guyanensis]